MLATILKSPQAVQATLAIIETFAKIRQLSRSIQALSVVKDKADQKALMQRSADTEDYIEWANDYQHYISIRRDLEIKLRHVA